MVRADPPAARAPDAGHGVTVLAVVDRTFFASIPLLVLTVVLGMPTIAGTWSIVGAVVLAATLALGLYGRAGKARWRGAAYTAIAASIAISTLWAMGPLTGVGTMLGLACIFAGAFLSPRWLVVTVGGVLVALASRAYVGGRLELAHAVDGRIEISAALWIGTALASGTVLWVATRVLSALVTSLERSYTRAAEAYRQELATRVELERSRQELEQLAQVELVGRLAGGVAHDINNALAAIFGASDVLATMVATAEQRRDIAELQAASQHAADLVRDLLWIGHKFPSPSGHVADLDVTIRACQERLERVARTITIAVDVEPGIMVSIAPEHLEQVLFGFVLRAHRSGVTRLALTSEPAERAVAIVLRACGGQDRAGDLGSLQRQLGTSAARELLAQAGGALTTHDDAGSLVVRIEVPVPVRPRRHGSSPRAAMRTALVVDDEPMVLRRLCQLVRRRGYDVSSAATVSEGMALLEANPDLLVTDIQLPDGSGEAIALASYARDPDRPIIVCSGFGADDGLRARLQPARVRVLTKPFSSCDLDAMIPDAAVAAP